MAIVNDVPSIRIFGTSWATRGPSYWLRRTGVTVVALIMLVAIGSIYLSVASAVIEAAHGKWRAIALVGFALLAIWSVAASYYAYRPLFVAQRLRDTRALRDIVGKSGTRRAGRMSGVGLGASALAGSTLIGGLLALGSVFVVGWPVIILYMSFRRYYTAEESLAALEFRQ